VLSESSDSEEDAEGSSPSKMFGVTSADSMVPTYSRHNVALSGGGASDSTGVGDENGKGAVAALRSDTDLPVSERLERASQKSGGV